MRHEEAFFAGPHAQRSSGKYCSTSTISEPVKKEHRSRKHAHRYSAMAFPTPYASKKNARDGPAGITTHSPHSGHESQPTDPSSNQASSSIRPSMTNYLCGRGMRIGIRSGRSFIDTQCMLEPECGVRSVLLQLLGRCGERWTNCEHVTVDVVRNR